MFIWVNKLCEHWDIVVWSTEESGSAAIFHVWKYLSTYTNSKCLCDEYKPKTCLFVVKLSGNPYIYPSAY